MHDFITCIKIPNSFTLFKRFYLLFKDFIFSFIYHLKITAIYAYKLFCYI
ncbi:hypothetical protein C1646_721874 [Rhizophagus diaphanus]|nr:hypothetical protein C1646_721874 [Rhizophagus diaphanus] [Rhizophagus sp. MUCL 43196]